MRTCDTFLLFILCFLALTTFASTKITHEFDEESLERLKENLHPGLRTLGTTAGSYADGLSCTVNWDVYDKSEPENAIPCALVSNGSDMYFGFMGVAMRKTAVTPCTTFTNHQMTFTFDGAALLSTLGVYVTINPSWDAKWVPAQDGQLPDNAVQLGGDEKDTFFVGMTPEARNTNSRIGAIVPRLGQLVYAFDDGVHRSSKYLALTLTHRGTKGTSMYVAVDHAMIPKEAIDMGRDAFGNEMYVGVCRFTNTTVMPCENNPSKKMMIATYDGKVLYSSQSAFYVVDDGYYITWRPYVVGADYLADAAKLGSYSGYTQYVGRFQVAGMFVIGRAVPEMEVMFYRSGEVEQVTRVYEILLIKKEP